MKAFITTENYLLLHCVDGRWTDGDVEYHDFSGNPVGFDGVSVEGTHLNIVVQSEKGGLFSSGCCTSHGVAIQFHCADGSWADVSYADNLEVLARHLVEDILSKSMMVSDPTKYRLLSCDCADVVRIPEMMEAC